MEEPESEGTEGADSEGTEGAESEGTEAPKSEGTEGAESEGTQAVRQVLLGLRQSVSASTKTQNKAWQCRNTNSNDITREQAQKNKQESHTQ